MYIYIFFLARLVTGIVHGLVAATTQRHGGDRLLASAIASSPLHAGNDAGCAARPTSVEHADSDEGDLLGNAWST